LKIFIDNLDGFEKEIEEILKSCKTVSEKISTLLSEKQ